MPMLGRQEEGDPWGLLASQPSLIGELQTKGSSFTSKEVNDILEDNTQGSQ